MRYQMSDNDCEQPSEKLVSKGKTAVQETILTAVESIVFAVSVN